MKKYTQKKKSLQKFNKNPVESLKNRSIYIINGLI